MSKQYILKGVQIIKVFAFLGNMHWCETLKETCYYQYIHTYIHIFGFHQCHIFRIDSTIRITGMFLCSIVNFIEKKRWIGGGFREFFSEAASAIMVLEVVGEQFSEINNKKLFLLILPNGRVKCSTKGHFFEEVCSRCYLVNQGSA